eukprot:g72958.t1
MLFFSLCSYSHATCLLPPSFCQLTDPAKSTASYKLQLIKCTYLEAWPAPCLCCQLLTRPRAMPCYDMLCFAMPAPCRCCQLPRPRAEPARLLLLARQTAAMLCYAMLS